MKELYSKALSSLSIASLRSTKVKADLRLYQCMGLHATSRKKGTACVLIARSWKGLHAFASQQVAIRTELHEACQDEVGTTG